MTIAPTCHALRALCSTGDQQALFRTLFREHGSSRAGIHLLADQFLIFSQYSKSRSPTDCSSGLLIFMSLPPSTTTSLFQRNQPVKLRKVVQ